MSHKLTAGTIGLRAQEFHEGLRDVTAFGPKEAHLQTTILVGKAASLATHLKGLLYVEDMQALKFLAAELGITSVELRPVLNVLEEVDFATVVTAGKQIKRIELRVPVLRNGYNDLGEYWLQSEPGEIERAALTVLDDIAAFPHRESNIKEYLGLEDKVFNMVYEIGNAGALLDKYQDVDDETMLYSPLTVEEKPQPLLALAQVFQENNVIAALGEVESRQGIVPELLSDRSKRIIDQAIMLGVLSPVQLSMGNENRIFLFSPYGGLQKEERIILEKARAILACVRCGEHYASTRKIFSPRRILETLRDNKRFRYPRPDVPEQYGLLVTKQIGVIEPDSMRPGFFHFSLHVTPENMHALDIAIALLEADRLPKSRLELDAKEFFSIRGNFTGTLPTRSRMRMSRNIMLSREVACEIFGEISKLARGVS